MEEGIRGGRWEEERCDNGINMSEVPNTGPCKCHSELHYFVCQPTNLMTKWAA